LFESNLSSRMYKLNRPKKLNSLNKEMIDLLRPKIDVRAPERVDHVVVDLKTHAVVNHLRLGKNRTCARSSSE
jgi:hypothetical protein